MKKLKIRYQSRYKPRHKISNQAGYDVLGKLKQKKLYRKKWFRINDKTTPFLKYSHRSSLERLYGERLRAKQVLRQTYGKLTERQFKTIFHKSEFGYSKSKRSLKGLLDRRLDAFIFRLGYATSIFKARQDIIHGAFKVNGYVVKSPSISLTPGDCVSPNGNVWYSFYKTFFTRIKGKDNKKFGPWRGSRKMSNIEFDYRTLTAAIVDEFNLNDFSYEGKINLKSAREFYN